MTNADNKLAKVSEEIGRYHYALDTHQDGGVAQNKAFNAIEKILGMHWDESGAARAARAAAQSAKIDNDPLKQIETAVTGYYYALDTRQHGGLAQDMAVKKIEQVLGQHWSRDAADMKRRAEQFGPSTARVKK